MSNPTSRTTALFTPDQDALIVQLKEEGKLSWKDIATEFEKSYPNPKKTPGALQVRYARNLAPHKRGTEPVAENGSVKKPAAKNSKNPKKAADKSKNVKGPRLILHFNPKSSEDESDKSSSQHSNTEQASSDQNTTSRPNKKAALRPSTTGQVSSGQKTMPSLKRKRPTTDQVSSGQNTMPSLKKKRPPPPSTTEEAPPRKSLIVRLKLPKQQIRPGPSRIRLTNSNPSSPPSTTKKQASSGPTKLRLYSSKFSLPPSTTEQASSSQAAQAPTGPPVSPQVPSQLPPPPSMPPSGTNLQGSAGPSANQPISDIEAAHILLSMSRGTW